jgi:hypothetical protein
MSGDCLAGYARDRVTVVPVQAVRRDPTGPRRVLHMEVVRQAGRHACAHRPAFTGPSVAGS